MDTTKKLLQSENTEIVRTIQRYLTTEELEDLNMHLYEFADLCLSSRPNPSLNQALYSIKIKFKRLDQSQ